MPLRARALRYLREHHVMTLATQDSDRPWGASVFYASEDFRLYFLSSPRSRHARNLVTQSAVAATIQGDCIDWREIRGIQLEGVARPLSGDEAQRARRLYAMKFPIVSAAGGAPAAIAEALAKISWYLLVPERLYFIDNSRGFGHRDEVLL